MPTNIFICNSNIGYVTVFICIKASTIGVHTTEKTTAVAGLATFEAYHNVLCINILPCKAVVTCRIVISYTNYRSYICSGSCCCFKAVNKNVFKRSAASSSKSSNLTTFCVGDINILKCQIVHRATLTKISKETSSVLCRSYSCVIDSKIRNSLSVTIKFTKELCCSVPSTDRSPSVPSKINIRCQSDYLTFKTIACIYCRSKSKQFCSSTNLQICCNNRFRLTAISRNI